MSYLSRVLADASDRENWLWVRSQAIIGASDAAKLAKPESIDKYAAALLAEKSFAGNAYTEAGHEWEPRLLAWAGIPQNTYLIHSEVEQGFAATPDGLQVLDDGRIALGEAKIKHNRIVTGPTLGEKRQVAWQQFCVGNVAYTDFVWGELVNGELRTLEPKSLRIYPADVAHLLPPILEIARPLLARLRAALEFERSLTA